MYVKCAHDAGVCVCVCVYVDVCVCVCVRARARVRMMHTRHNNYCSYISRNITASNAPRMFIKKTTGDLKRIPCPGNTVLLRYEEIHN